MGFFRAWHLAGFLRQCAQQADCQAEVGWDMEVGGRQREQWEGCHYCKAQHISLDSEVSTEAQMCEERLSEGESHTCDYFFHVCKNFYGLGAGP